MIRQLSCARHARLVCPSLAILLFFLPLHGWQTWADTSNKDWELAFDRCVDLMRRERISEGKDFAAVLVAKADCEVGEQSDRTANAVHWLAFFTQMAGDLRDAERLWHRALSIDETLYGKGSLGTSRRLLMLGGFYRDQGDFEKAQAYLSDALRIRQEKLGPASPEAANALWSLGRLAILVGAFEKADSYFRRALAAFEASDDPDVVPARFNVILDQAGLHLNLDDLVQARTLAHDSLDLISASPLSEQYHSLRCRPLEMLAEIAVRRREYPAAEGFLKQSESLVPREGALDAAQCEHLRSLRERLGILSLYLGRISEAEALLLPAAEAAATNRALPLSTRKESLLRLCELKRNCGDWTAAEQLARRACSLVSSAHFPALADRIDTLRNLVETETAEGKTRAAISRASELQDLEEHQIQDFLSFTSERQRLAFLRRLSERHCAVWAKLGAVQPLARGIIRTKGLTLDSMREDRLITGQNHSPETSEILDQAQMASQRVIGLNSTLAAARSDDPRLGHWLQQMSEAKDNLGTLEAALAREANACGKARRALRVTAEHVQQAIPKNAALAEFLRYGVDEIHGTEFAENYGVLLFFATGAPRWIPLGPCAFIDRQIALYRHALHEATENNLLAATLRELSARLWQPIAAQLSGQITRIIVSPDGQLDFVSFGALLSPNGRFTGEDYSITYVATGRDLLEPAPAAADNRTLAILANPGFRLKREAGDRSTNHPLNRTAFAEELTGLAFPPLPGAKKEGDLLNQNWMSFGVDQCLLFEGDDANEECLRGLRRPYYLHLATHAFALAPAESADSGTVDLANPMLRSGLALAGAQDTIDNWRRGVSAVPEKDGLLTAAEIAALDLQRTELVVLSACDSGSGLAQAGEGVLGLRRAFATAGVHNLVAALWPVSDRETAAFMVDFYRALGTGESPCGALAKTQAHWLGKLRRERGPTLACRVIGTFVISSLGSSQ